jgi:hypothetical protein
MMMRRFFKIFIGSILVFLILNVMLAFVTNVSTDITDSDQSVFRVTLGLVKPKGPLTYSQEILLIHEVQALVLYKVPVGNPIPDYSDREPVDLFKQKSGLCYDRARTYDKIFSWLGFETRHVYILYPEDPVTKVPLSLWKAGITRGTNSHAVTEVKTKQGWVLVDSNSSWISVISTGHIGQSVGCTLAVDSFIDPTYLTLN